MTANDPPKYNSVHCFIQKYQEMYQQIPIISYVPVVGSVRDTRTC